MAELIKCMECGGMVSSEANQCLHCKTDSNGIKGVKCTTCGGLLKFSEAIKVNDYYDEGAEKYIYRSFHNSCYQQISCKIVEKKLTINCPVCGQPNQFSYGNSSHGYSRSHRTERINCAKCAHPYEYKQTAANDPYASCKYCRFLLEKDLEVKILNPYNKDFYDYVHKLCNNKERQAQELETKKYYENQEIMRNEEKHKMERKKAKENVEVSLKETFIPILLFGGFCVYVGGFWTPLFCVFLALYLIFCMVEYFK